LASGDHLGGVAVDQGGEYLGFSLRKLVDAILEPKSVAPEGDELVAPGRPHGDVTIDHVVDGRAQLFERVALEENGGGARIERGALERFVD